MIGLRIRGGAWPGWTNAIFGALAGAVGGTLIWLVDVPTVEGTRASITGSILAIFAFIFGFVPVFGLLFAIPAFLLNRQVAGWQNRASRWGLGLCVVVTLVVMVMSQVPLQ